MNDRDLLELAAKAAGHPIDPIDSMHDPEEWACWNPLADDGDALRLAVKLMLSVTIGPCQAQAVSISGALRGEFPTEDAIYQDMGIATRRAITRAAAAIGQSMTEEQIA